MSNSHAPSNSADFPCYCTPQIDCVDIVNTGSATLATGVLSIPAAPGAHTFQYWDIESAGKQCYSAGVNAVDEFTPSGFTLGTCCGETSTYIILLQPQTCGNESDVSPFEFSVTVNETTTGAELVDAFVALINSSDAPVSAVDAGNTFVVTADDPGCIMQYTFVSDNIAHLAFTDPVVPFGTPALVEAAGIDPTYITASSYHGVYITYRDYVPDTDMCDACKTVCTKTCLIFFADNSAGDSFISSLSTIMTGGDTASHYLSKSGALTGC